MTIVTVSLENCYGIRKLHHRFHFSERNAYSIYAPNGSMKSSLAQTFKDLSEGSPSQDRIFPSRQTTRVIQDESGTEIRKEQILVLPPYDEFFSHTDKTSTLLVNNALRREYELLHADIEKSKIAFLLAMQEQSRSKKQLDAEIALAFTKSDDEESFYLALERIAPELNDQSDAPFADVPYDSIFDPKVLEALSSNDMRSAIEDYIARYNQLLENSTYFTQGVFEYFNAAQIAKNLASNGFFSANHTVTLNAGEQVVISSKKQLEDIVARELAEITNDGELKKRFAVVRKQLERNIQLRQFQRYVCSNVLLLPHLSNVDLFKEQVWKSYFKAKEPAYDELLSKYREVKARRKEIEQEAQRERTLWEDAIQLFNDRFFVPFTLYAKNKAAVMLRGEDNLELGYRFRDGDDEVEVRRDELMKTLSQGEKKALYILNIIFEIEVRRKNQQETLFVVDDIADSFDYKNKYAIIQYLQDVSDVPDFRQIILTHNFDFFRTISSRFVGYAGCLTATKSSDRVELSQAFGIRNPFLYDWKQRFFVDPKKRIASISFMRNLVEHILGESDPNYLRLTSLLHWKSDSQAITQSDLDQIYANVFSSNSSTFANRNERVVDMIEREANDCLTAGDGVNFEHKIVLSIEIRLASERFMIGMISDPAFLVGLGTNQTMSLLKRFIRDHGHRDEQIRILRKVVLMTPEHIHLNAFMYEPILDMSDDSLRSLYREVQNLSC